MADKIHNPNPNVECMLTPRAIFRSFLAPEGARSQFLTSICCSGPTPLKLSVYMSISHTRTYPRSFSRNKCVCKTWLNLSAFFSENRPHFVRKSSAFCPQMCPQNTLQNVPKTVRILSSNVSAKHGSTCPKMVRILSENGPHFVRKCVRRIHFKTLL